MLHLDCIGIEVKSQGYEGRGIQVSPDEQEAALIMEKRTGKRSCPKCDQPSYINGIARMQLKDVPIIAGCKQSLLCLYHQYQCPKCGKTFKDEVPFAYPGTRITQRAAGWIRMLLANRMSVRAIQQITGIHWDTIHKGHSYATCVLDLESGEVLWVGKGRAKTDFARFFEEIDSELLSCVEAVAMDMNASYNLLVREHLPDAQIVYDRFHMQAQFGKEVLGVVRLAQAREHKANADAIVQGIPEGASPEQKKEAAALKQLERQQYRSLKRLRWPLLMNRENLSQEAAQNLDAILTDHADLAVCHAMKEDMCRLFALRDPVSARSGWKRWFSAALESGIPPLMKFAALKESRMDGLVNHASFPISTGKLEGFNNKIKLVKRIAFGYRDEAFFFALVRFFSLHSSLHHFS